MQTPPSPLETLRQLKEMLDAGTITAAEFEALKQKLVFTDAAAVGPAAPAEPLAVQASVTPPLPPTIENPVPAATMDEQAQVISSPMPAPAELRPLAEDEMQGFEPQPARNPLNLVLSIAGLLALLGLVIYLSFNNRPSEHLTSGSQTAADSVDAMIETGPQAEQQAPVEAVPETVRLAPVRPATPVPAPRPAPAATDSGAAGTAEPAATDSAAN